MPSSAAAQRRSAATLRVARMTPAVTAPSPTTVAATGIVPSAKGLLRATGSLPKGFHRIRHYGLLANGNRADNLAKARKLLAVPPPAVEPEPEPVSADQPRALARPCPCCGSRMLVIEVFARGHEPRHRPTPLVVRIDTS